MSTYKTTPTQENAISVPVSVLPIAKPVPVAKPVPLVSASSYHGGRDIELATVNVDNSLSKTAPYSLTWNKLTKNNNNGNYKDLENNIGSLRSGEMIGLIGLTKCGKTPLMKIFC